jgi:hypothetical protein
MKLVARLLDLPGGLRTRTYCAEDGGRVDRAMTDTLLVFVSETCPRFNDDIEDLLRRAESGTHVPERNAQPDYSSEATAVRVMPPGDEPAGVTIAHEYIEEFATDTGTPQRFTFAQLRFAMAHWTEFVRRLRADGEEAWLDRPFESDLPR